MSNTNQKSINYGHLTLTMSLGNFNEIKAIKRRTDLYK